MSRTLYKPRRRHWTPEARARVSATTRAYWASPAGQAQREAQRAAQKTPEAREAQAARMKRYWASPAGIAQRAVLGAAASARAQEYWTEERRAEASARLKALPAGEIARRAAAGGARMKALWAALSDDERAHRYRQMAANYMVTRPEIAIYPDRWLADALGGNG